MAALCASLCLVGAASLLTGSVARGDDVEPAGLETVRNRARPELDPLGIRLGSFLLYPQIAVGLELDDNLLRSERDRSASLMLRAAPSFRLASDWNNHSLEVSASVDAAESVSGERNRFLDGAVGIAGRLDVLRDTKVFGTILYEDLHEDRASPELAGSQAFTPLQRITGNLGIRHLWGRWSGTVEGRMVLLDFGDGTAPGGIRLDNDDRDRTVYLLAGRLGYELMPGYEAFARLTANDRAYSESRDAFGFRRDSSGYEAVAGLALDLTGLAEGELFAGYREQSYRDPDLNPLGGFTFGARVTAIPTPLLTLVFDLQRDVEDSNLARGSGFFDTTVQLAADYELLRNLVLSAAVGYNWQEFKGLDRQDEAVRVTGSATYWVNRHLTLGFVFDRESRSSDGRDAGADYTANRFIVKLTGYP